MSLISSRSEIELLGTIGVNQFGAGAQHSPHRSFTVLGQALTFGEVEIDDLVISGAEFTTDHAASARLPSTNSVRVFFVLSGKMDVTEGGRRLSFVAGTAGVIPDGCTPALSCAAECRVLRIRMSPDHLERYGAATVHRFAAVAMSTVSREPALDYLLLLTRTGHDHSISASPTSAVIARLIGRMVRADDVPHRGGPPASAEHASTPERVDDALVTARLRTLLGQFPLAPNTHLDDLARACGFRTKKELSMLTRAVYGLTLSEFVDSLRIA